MQILVVSGDQLIVECGGSVNQVSDQSGNTYSMLNNHTRFA